MKPEGECRGGLPDRHSASRVSIPAEQAKQKGATRCGLRLLIFHGAEAGI